MNTLEAGLVTVGVDIQNDFCPGGSLAVPNGDLIVAPFNDITAETRRRGGKVVLTRDWHPADTTDHFITWPPHCIAGTPGAEFHPDLKIMTNDIIISKGTRANEDAYSGFEGMSADGQTLESVIRAELEKHKRVVVLMGGLATDYCLEATVLGALELRKKVGTEHLRVIVLRECIKAVNINPDDGQNAIIKMHNAGAEFACPEGEN